MSANYYRVCSCTLPYSDPTACERCGVFRMPTITTTSPGSRWYTVDDLGAELRRKFQTFDATLRRIREHDKPNTKGTDERYKR